MVDGTIVATLCAAIAALFEMYRRGSEKQLEDKDKELAKAYDKNAQLEERVEKLEGIIDRNTSALMKNANTQERMMNHLEKERSRLKPQED